MKAELQLHVTCAEGREVECARHLYAETRGRHRQVLVALAAEIVSEHERVAAGSAAVVVVGPDQAARVLEDLYRAK